MSLNYYALHITRIRRAFDEDFVRASLLPFSHAIDASAARLDAAASEGDDEYIDIIAESETDLIENYLGASFVIAQTFVTSVVSAVKRLHAFHAKAAGHHLNSTSGVKEDILRLGSNSTGAVSQLQVVDAFANYFKHRDEWPPNWTNAPPNAKHTISVITAVGATDGSNSNLRRAAAVLGFTSYADIVEVAPMLDSWKSQLEVAYRAELSSAGLL